MLELKQISIMKIRYSKKEITQIFLLAVVFTVLFRVASIYATWTLPVMPPNPPAIPAAAPYDVIGPVINTGPIDQTKLFANNKGYLQLDSLAGSNQTPVQVNSGLKGGNSTLCADANGYMKICVP